MLCIAVKIISFLSKRTNLLSYPAKLSNIQQQKRFCWTIKKSLETEGVFKNDRGRKKERGGGCKMDKGKCGDRTKKRDLFRGEFFSFRCILDEV